MPPLVALIFSLALKPHIERVDLLLVAGVAHVGNLHELEVFSVSEPLLELHV